MSIEKIFIINLKERTDRKKQIIEELNKYNITNYEFFEAIKPTPREINDWNHKFLHATRHDLQYQTGCLGCMKSHIKIMNLSLERGYKKILIIEDDAIFNDSLSKLQECTKVINDDYDILYLSGSHTQKNHKINQFIMRVKGTLCTIGYVITENVMKFIVKNIIGYSREIDHFLAKEVQPIFKCYCITPHLISSASGFSDIQGKYVEYAMTNPY